MSTKELKLQGSASSLVQVIKAFSAAGINNSMIAIFDNDTAARDAIKKLDKLPVADNIRVMRLPELEILNNYPTSGPQGNNEMNVNGLAGSIELYFEDSTLKDKNNSYFPVVWKGFVDGVKDYQGEVCEKGLIQSHFANVLDRIEAGEAISNFNFSSMKKVFQKVFGFTPTHF